MGNSAGRRVTRESCPQHFHCFAVIHTDCENAKAYQFDTFRGGITLHICGVTAVSVALVQHCASTRF